MIELIIVSIAAIVALVFSFVTATSVLYLKRKFNPIVDAVDIEGIQTDFHDLKDDMHWFRKYAASAPNVMMDTMEGVIDEKTKVIFAELECIKDEFLEFANGYGQQMLAGGARLLQGRGASLLGKEGREKSLANAQIKRAKDEVMRQAIQTKLPEGISIDMAEQVANQFGYELADVEAYLPMIMKAFPNLIGGNGPGVSPPPQRSLPPQSQPSGYKPLGEL